MSKVPVNLNEPSPYIEGDSWPHRLKRKLSYRFTFKLIRKFKPDLIQGALFEVGPGSGLFLAFCSQI